MSSSTSGHCTPWPSPISCQLARWAGVASDSRHDHARGTLITRPSTKCAVIVSSVTSTRAIRDSTLTAVFMPCLDDRRFVFDDKPTDLIQLARTEPMVPCQCRGRQPKLCVLPITSQVDVHGFVAVETIEEEPIRPGNTGNPRHVGLAPGPNDRRHESAKTGSLIVSVSPTSPPVPSSCPSPPPARAGTARPSPQSGP